MIVRNLKSLTGTDRRVASHSSNSTRFLLADDGMGYSLNLTEIEAGLEIEMRYDHHFETVYCISGTGSIVDMATRGSSYWPGDALRAGQARPPHFAV